MALNFGLLNQGGPSGFYEGFTQAGEKMQANAMAQQRAAQAQQEFGMRQQEFAAGQADKQRVAKAAVVTQKTASAREAILNARTPDDARAIEIAQHNDSDLGPIRRQFGSLEADLADIPNDLTAFNQWKLKQALGAAKFIERMDADAQFASAMGGTQAMPQAAPTNAMAPAGAAAPAPMANAMLAPAMSGELQTKLDQRKRLALIADQTPRVKANIDILDKEIARLSPAATKNIANVNPNDFTLASIQKFNDSGKYSDLVRVPAVVVAGGAGGAGGAAGTGTVEVVNPKDPTTTIIVTKARAVAEGLTPAKAMEGLTPVQRQKLEASYPQATAALKGHQNKTALFIKDLEALRDSAGLDSVTGFAAGRAPGLTDDGRRTVALYDKIIAKGGFQSLQEMRDMSKTGGALGNVSDRENTQLKASFAAIDRKQNANDVRVAIDDLITELKGGVGRLQDAYDLTYEYKRNRAALAANQYVEIKTLPDGRKLGKKADGTVEEIK